MLPNNFDPSPRQARVFLPGYKSSKPCQVYARQQPAHLCPQTDLQGRPSRRPPAVFHSGTLPPSGDLGAPSPSLPPTPPRARCPPLEPADLSPGKPGALAQQAPPAGPGSPNTCHQDAQPATSKQTQLLFPGSHRVPPAVPFQISSPALRRETPNSPPPPPSSGTGPRTYSPPTAPPEPHCACADRALRAEARGRGASGCGCAPLKTGQKDFRSAGHSGLEGGGDLVWDAKLRNRLLLADSAVKVSDGRLGSVGGVRGIVHGRTHGRAARDPALCVGLPGEQGGGFCTLRLPLTPSLESGLNILSEHVLKAAVLIARAL